MRRGGLFYHIMNLISYGFKHYAIRDKLFCQCKGEMHIEREYLFLLPLRFGEMHEENAEYYMNHGKQIQSLSDITTGQRAFYLRVLRCGDCGDRRVSITDFLKVRDESTVKSVGNYPYDEFAEFINRLS